MNYLIENKKLRDAFGYINRTDFVPEREKDAAHMDVPLPIGRGQTISQPQVVAFMLDLLSAEEGDRILDVGFGSGWTTALLAFLVGDENGKNQAKIIAIERDPELYEFGKGNLEKYGFLENGLVEVFCGDGKEGKEEYAPFDKILVSAAVSDNLPLPLKKQLKVGGRAVIPINSSIFLFTKEEDGFKTKEYPGFAFVPLL